MARSNGELNAWALPDLSWDKVSMSFLLLLPAFVGLTLNIQVSPVNTTFFTIISQPMQWEMEGNFSFARAL